MDFYRECDGLTFQADGHRYELDGKRVMSLTQILSAAGLVDYSAVNPQVLADKAKFGTKIHEYTLWNDKGDLDMDDLKPYPKYWNRVEGWRQFCEDFKFIPEVQLAEVPCACRVNGILYAMTIDRLGTIVDGEQQAIVEIKTCAGEEPSHPIQTGGQAIPFKEFYKGNLKRYAVYLLDAPNGAGRLYKAVEHTDRMDEKIFLSALALTQFRLNHKLL